MRSIIAICCNQKQVICKYKKLNSYAICSTCELDQIISCVELSNGTENCGNFENARASSEVTRTNEQFVWKLFGQPQTRHCTHDANATTSNPEKTKAHKWRPRTDREKIHQLHSLFVAAALKKTEAIFWWQKKTLSPASSHSAPHVIDIGIIRTKFLRINSPKSFYSVRRVCVGGRCWLA